MKEVCFVFLVILLVPVTADAASFDCSQARSTLEVLICADAGLSSLDEGVGEAYSELRSNVPPGSNEKAELLNEQREFLKKRTEACPLPSSPEMITCLKRFYTLRLNALKKQIVALAKAGRFHFHPRDEGEVPPDLVATLQKDLDDPDFCPEQRFKECVRATWLDLSCDVMIHGRQVRIKRPALLVEELSPSTNWEHLLYIRAGNGWREIFDDIGQSLDPSCGTHGWADLEVSGHGAGVDEQKVYQFDGNVYRETACEYVDPGNPATGKKSHSEPCD
jgi:uncharacterized protein